MPRANQNSTFSDAVLQTIRSNELIANPEISESRATLGGITALSIEFVAKPSETGEVQASLPAAIQGALGDVAGFAGCFVMIANHEARLVTVVTLWKGEDRARRCSENLRWVRALLAPYLDRSLRVQTMTAFVPGAMPDSRQFEHLRAEMALGAAANEQEILCVL